MSTAPQQFRTYFITFSTAGRRRIFQIETNAAVMVDTLQHYREQGRFLLHAFVIMPDHVHVLITPAAEVSLEKAIQFMKGGFSFRLKSKLEVWERGHFDKRVPDQHAYDVCVLYIHRNPVEARLVPDGKAYAFSSAARMDEFDPAPSWVRSDEKPRLKPR
jgi:putative transposase